MVMTIRPMSSGKGFEDLLKSVVVGDGDREMSSPLTRYYTESGCPPGTWVGTGLMPSNAKAAQRNDVNFVGSFSGAMAQSPSDASAAEMLPGDLETGRLLGQRVAAVAARLGD